MDGKKETSDFVMSVFLHNHGEEEVIHNEHYYPMIITKFFYHENHNVPLNENKCWRLWSGIRIKQTMNTGMVHNKYYDDKRNTLPWIKITFQDCNTQFCIDMNVHPKIIQNLNQISRDETNQNVCSSSTR